METLDRDFNSLKNTIEKQASCQGNMDTLTEERNELKENVIGISNSVAKNNELIANLIARRDLQKDRYVKTRNNNESVFKAGFKSIVGKLWNSSRRGLIYTKNCLDKMA